MAEVVAHFTHSGLVPESSLPRYEAALDRGRRLRDSTVAEVVLVGLAVLGVVVIRHEFPFGRKAKLGRHFYVRQLKDMKFAPLVELFSPVMMTQYAEICGWALARAHARPGDPAAISEYLSKSDAFDKVIVKSSIAYADQTERDHDVLRKAVQTGRVEVVMETE